MTPLRGEWSWFRSFSLIAVGVGSFVSIVVAVISSSEQSPPPRRRDCETVEDESLSLVCLCLSFFSPLSHCEPSHLSRFAFSFSTLFSHDGQAFLCLFPHLLEMFPSKVQSSLLQCSGQFCTSGEMATELTFDSCRCRGGDTVSTKNFATARTVARKVFEELEQHYSEERIQYEDGAPLSLSLCACFVVFFVVFCLFV